MLSAVETFGGTATAAAHNPFAIAAAAVVMPTQNHLQQSGQVSLEHYTIGHSTLLSSHHHHNHHHHQNNNNNNSHNQQHHRNNFNHHQILSNQSTSGGLYPVYSSSSSSSSPSSTSCSPPINQNKSKSPRLNTSDCNSEIIAMSSTEFVRPHPKQPRYSTANNNNNNNNINNNNNNSNFGNNNINNNNNIGSNGIPLQIRNNKIGNTIGCNNNSAGTKSSIGRQRKYSAEPQSGPVNLVTNNNNNNNNNSIKNNNNSNNNNNNGCRLSSPNELVEINGNNVIGCGTGVGGVGIPLLQQKQNSSPQLTGGGSTLNDNDVISALYSQKLPFATAPTVVSNAIAAAAYQFNYPHIYARSPYGTPALYPSNHSLNSRIQQLQNAFIGSTHPNDLTFSPYLPTSIQQYNNNNTIVTGSLNILQKPPPTLSPTNLITSGVVNSNNNNNSLNNNNNNNNSRIIQQHYTMAQQQTTNPLPHIMEQTQQRSSMLHLNHHSDKELITNKNSLLSTYSTHNISNSSNTKIPMSLSSAGFKIPSGKDGSLKHRFLTRPTTENDQKKQKSQITTTILRSSNINTNAPSNFTKGSFIELCNGVLRKVEDMRTEDFIQSAERSQYHQLADSTVVKICSNTNSVIITFCYDKNKLKADVEVSLEHPFFVYGQGWASCNPELSLQTFGLKCQRLQVGDVCISLISRDETTTTTYNSPQPSYYKDNNNIDPLPPSFYPQNLSRKSHQSPTILTSSTGVAVSSRLSIPPPSPSSSSTLQVAAVYLPLSHVPPYDLHSYESKLSSLQNSVIGGSSGELISIYPKHAHGHEISRKSHTISEIVNSESTKSANATATYQLTNKTNNKDDIQGQDLTTNNISNNNNNSSNDEPIDVSLSRKRKCDDNEDFK